MSAYLTDLRDEKRRSRRMLTRFRDRAHAGTLLAEELADYTGRDEVLVLGLPRGGVQAAVEVAESLGAPLDVFLVRKMHISGDEEIAMGTIARGGVSVINHSIVEAFCVPQTTLQETIARQATELALREAWYRSGRPALPIADRCVILVDDGIATGATMRAAIQSVRAHHPSQVVVAVPVASSQTCQIIAAEADHFICLLKLRLLFSVGIWYDRFPTMTDEEVRRSLRIADERRMSGSAALPSIPMMPPTSMSR